MRVAFVGGFAWEPKGTMRLRAYPLAVELVKRGYEVTIFLTPYDNPSQSGKDWLQEGVQIRSLRVHPMRSGYPALLVRLLNAIHGYDPDIVHVFKPKGFAGAAAAYMMMRGNTNLAVDCDDWEGWGGWNDIKSYPWVVKQYIDWQERWIMRSAPAITVASRVLYDRVLDVRRGSRGVYYIPNCGVSDIGVRAQEAARSLDIAEQRASFNLPLNRLVIFYNGHFEPGDDIMFFCRATAPVALRTGAAIIFVGDGPDLPKVKEYLAGNYPGIDVRFFPTLPYTDFIRLIAVSDVAAFPYPDNPLHRAKCSTRIIDYMAMSRAVITTSVGQNTEYIVDGESGILTPPGDEAAFAQQLERLICDPELRARLGAEARRRVTEKFSWGSAPVEQCLKAYAQLISTN
jgi:glycosyltransferase involved in cell wall biosynthesis